MAQCNADVKLRSCKNYGCQATFEKEEDVEAHQKRCLYKRLVCPNCESTVLRKAFAKHIRESCEFRLVACSGCHEEVLQHDLKTHEQACQNSSKCHFCPQILPRHLWDDHIKSCPKRNEIRNITGAFGCGDNIQMASFKECAQDSEDRSKLLSNIAINLNEENKTLREKVHSMAERNEKWQDEVFRTFNETIRNQRKEVEGNLGQIDAVLRGCIQDQKEFNREVCERLDMIEAKLNSKIEATNPPRRATSPPPREIALRESSGVRVSIDLNSADVVTTLKNTTILSLLTALCEKFNKAPSQQNVVQVSHSTSLQYWKEGEQRETLGEAVVGRHRYNCELKYHFQLPYLLTYLCLHPVDGCPISTEWRGLAVLSDQNLMVLCYKPFKIMFEDKKKTRTSEAIEFPEQGALCGDKDVFIDFLLYMHSS